jgi:hypothetical protein
MHSWVNWKATISGKFVFWPQGIMLRVCGRGRCFPLGSLEAKRDWGPQIPFKDTSNDVPSSVPLLLKVPPPPKNAIGWWPKL